MGLHLHEMRDTDTHFIIDPVTRAISNTQTTKKLMQYDHNSEIFTFEIPRYIDKHDMQTCGKIEVHYINIDSKTKDQSKDVYLVADAALEDDTLVFSWLVSGNATKYAGSLNFLIRFSCLDEAGNVVYRWNTDIFKTLSVSDGFSNTETVVAEFSDTLEQWKIELENASEQETYQEQLDIHWALGGIGSDGSTNNNAARVRTVGFIPVSAGATIFLDDENTYKFNVAEYSSADKTAKTAYRTFGTDMYTVQSDGYIRASIALKNDIVQTDTHISRHLIFKTDKKTLEGRLDELEARSKYNRQVMFGACALQQYYRTFSGDFSLFNKSTSSEDFYSAFTALVSEHTDYCTVKTLGNGSDGKPIYAYDFAPIQFNYTPVVSNIPKILIISGQHGFEKCSCFGLYYFVRDLLNNWRNNTALDYIRNHVHLVILPCVNRYGFDNLEYKNANGVNLNRNYPVNFTVGTAGTDDYGGEAAFDQPETQMVRDLVYSHYDSVLFVDYHTNGNTNVSSWKYCNWHNFTENVLKDGYYRLLYHASGYHICNITPHFIADYGLNTGGSLCGSVSTTTNEDAATAKAWAESLGIMSLTFEGFNGFPSESVDYSENTQRANAELIGNYLGTALTVFAQAAVSITYPPFIPEV